MAHNVSREKQESRDRQITVLHSIEKGWKADLWCPGCEGYRIAPYAALIAAGCLSLTWGAAMRKLRCPTCRRKPTMVALHFGPTLVTLIKAVQVGDWR